MDYEKIKDTLENKLEKEMFDYKQGLMKTCTLDDLLNRSYQTVIKEEMKDLIIGSTLDKEKIKVLLKTDNILERLYNDYLKTDYNITSEIEESIEESISVILKEYQKKKEKAREWTCHIFHRKL